MKLPRIFGDKPIGSKFWINRQFELLEQQMGFIGQQFGYRKKLLPNGDIQVTLIQRNSLNPIHLVKIFTPPADIIIPTTTVELAVESGWLLVENRGDGILPYVYLWNTNTDEYTLFGPERAIPASGLDTLDSYPSSIPTQHPELFTEAKYTTTYALDKYKPEYYSGLTRLFVQTLIAIGKTFEDIFPNDWNAFLSEDDIYLRLGCVRSPNNVFWLIYASPGGVYACQIPLTNAPATILDQIAQYPNEADILDAERLRYMERAINPLYIVPVENANLAAVYVDDFRPFVWGWCWRYQTRKYSGYANCGAVITTVKNVEGTGYSSFKQYIRRSVLNITFDGNGLPVGNITVDADTTVTFAYNSTQAIPVYIVGTDNKVVSIFRQGSKYTGTGLGTFPFLWYYDPQGNLVSISFNKVSSISAYSSGKDSICGNNVSGTSTYVYGYPSGIAFRFLVGSTFYPLNYLNFGAKDTYVGQVTLSNFNLFSSTTSFGGGTDCAGTTWAAGSIPKKELCTVSGSYNHKNESTWMSGTGAVFHQLILSRSPGTFWFVAIGETTVDTQTWNYTGITQNNVLRRLQKADGSNWWYGMSTGSYTESGTLSYSSSRVVAWEGYSITPHAVDSLTDTEARGLITYLGTGIGLPVNFSASAYGPRSKAFGSKTPGNTNPSTPTALGRWIGGA